MCVCVCMLYEIIEGSGVRNTDMNIHTLFYCFFFHLLIYIHIHTHTHTQRNRLQSPRVERKAPGPARSHTNTHRETERERQMTKRVVGACVCISTTLLLEIYENEGTDEALEEATCVCERVCAQETEAGRRKYWEGTVLKRIKSPI
jgi:hypothetical protein